MLEKLLHTEGPVFGVLDKIGRMIVLSALWLVGCLPIVTICTSNAALYHAVLKTLRQEGSAPKDYWDTYKRCLLPGIGMTLICVGCAALLILLCILLFGTPIPVSGFGIAWILLLFFFCYTGPVLARFRRRFVSQLKLCFVMAVQYAHYSLLFLLGTALLIIAQLYVLPMALALLIPGVWCWILSFPMERVLHRYLRDSDEHPDGETGCGEV